MVRSFNQGTAPKPWPYCPTGASEGAGAVLFLAVGAIPRFIAGVSRLKRGVVRLMK